MRINALRLNIETAQGRFGFDHRFGRNLTIIRGRNSSGKSTLVNSLLYAIGMEELVGGRGEAVLPYAVKDWLEHEGSKIKILSSEVLVEVVGSSPDPITLRRAIRHPQRNGKLVEIAHSAVLTEGLDFQPDRSTYLFDAGAAQIAEGFHRFFEDFLGLTLPQVPSTSGGHTKLYLQTVFAALAVEQKRGWTDYIANIPFFGIREVRTKVVEYLLGMNVFEAAARRSELDADSISINNEWTALIRQIKQQADSSGIIVRDLPSVPRTEFGASTPTLRKRVETGEVDLRTYMETLRAEYQRLETRATPTPNGSAIDSQVMFDRLVSELQRLSNLYETSTAALTLRRASLSDMQELYAAAKEDLSKNKTTAKLRSLGAQHQLSLANDRCPTCHQEIVDSLVDTEIAGPQMDLAANIAYLEKQCAMFERQIAGLTQATSDSELVRGDLQRRIVSVREQFDSARKDLTTGAQQSRVELRRQLQIESELSQVEGIETLLAKLFVELQKLSGRLEKNQLARKDLPATGYSLQDEEKVRLFEKNFRANASAFEYESASIRDIEVNRNVLLPYLSQLELREVRADIKADSSASDFVRLIWSYLLALYQTSSQGPTPGNHPGFLLFDEPGQHSMAAASQHALMQVLAGENHLQAIVAASFDESEGVFREATAGVDFQLIQLEEKAIQRLD